MCDDPPSGLHPANITRSPGTSALAVAFLSKAAEKWLNDPPFTKAEWTMFIVQVAAGVIGLLAR